MSTRSSGRKVRAVITHLLDREGDTYDNLTFARAKGHRIITRAAQEHVIAEAPGSIRKLLESSQGWAGETTCEREVPTKAAGWKGSKNVDVA